MPGCPPIVVNQIFPWSSHCGESIRESDSELFEAPRCTPFKTTRFTLGFTSRKNGHHSPRCTWSKEKLCVLTTVFLVPLARSAAFISGTVSYKQILERSMGEMGRGHGQAPDLPWKNTACFIKGKHGVQPWYLRLTLFDILPHVFSFKGFRFSGKQDASFVSHDRLVLIK
jgi:hypothetical protein